MATVGLSLLYAILKDENVSEFVGLSPRSFSGEIETKAYTFVSTFFQKYKRLPDLGLFTKKFQMDAVPEKVDYWRDQLRRRDAILLYEQAVNESITKKLSAGDIVGAKSSLLDLAMRLESIDKQRPGVPASQMVSNTLDAMSERRLTSGISGLTTPWESLTKILRGMRRGNLYALCARPKTGKSQIVNLLSKHCADTGAKAIILSMEMSEEEWSDRFTAITIKVGTNPLLSGHISTVGESHFRSTVGSNEYPKFFEGAFRTSVTDIEYLLFTERPDILFIDGAYLIKIPDAPKAWNKTERVADIAERLKIMAAEWNVVIFCTYQMKRDYRKGEDGGGAGDVQYSDVIGQIVTALMAMFRTEENKFIRRIQVTENRLGIRGGITINWLWDDVDFREIDSRSEGDLHTYLAEQERDDGDEEEESQ